MTARFLHSFPFRNALHLLKQNQKFFIVTCVLQILGIPLIIGNLMLQLYNEYSEYSENIYSSTNLSYLCIGCFCLAVATMLGIFYGINAYQEEWKKSSVDMLYALPLTNKQRFFSNYLGGLSMYAIPYLVSVLIGLILLLVLSPMVHAALLSDPENADILSRIYVYYFLLSTGLLVLMWMYYTISALVASCCGTLFENIYTNILLNLLLPGTAAVLLAVITNAVESIEFSYSWDFIGYTSPIGALIYLFYLICTKAEEIEVQGYRYYYSTYEAAGGTPGNLGLAPAYLRWIGIITLVTVLLLILAWQLYEHRKAEQVGKPFVYIGIFYIILTSVTVCILCICESGGIDVLLPVLLFSMIVYFIMEIIRKRGFRKFWQSVLSYAITVVVTLSGLHAISATDAFGRAYYIPPVATVSSVKLEFSGNEDTLDYTLWFSDKETIRNIQDFHRSCIQEIRTDTGSQVLEGMKGYYTISYSEYDTNGYFVPRYTPEEEDAYSSINERGGADWFYRNSGECSITYYTVTGSAIYRTYDISLDRYLQLTDVYAGTEAFAEACSDVLNRRLNNEYQEVSYTEDNRRIVHVPEATTRFSVEAVSQRYSINQECRTYLSVSDLEKNIQLLTETYQKDMLAMTSEQLRTEEIVAYILNMPVYACNTDTYALLESWGFQPFSLQQRYYNEDTQSSYGSVFGLRIYAPGDYRTCSLDYPYTTLSSIYYHPDDTENGTPCYEDNVPGFDNVGFDTGMQEYYPELYALLGVARRYYSTDQPCYLLLLNQEPYLIPPEYAELAEAVIAKGSYYIFPASFYFMDGAEDVFDEQDYNALQEYYSGAFKNGSVF